MEDILTTLARQFLPQMEPEEKAEALRSLKRMIDEESFRLARDDSSSPRSRAALARSDSSSDSSPAMAESRSATASFR